MDNTIKKLLAVLCCLALPILFYEQAVFLIARILNSVLLSLEENTPGSSTAVFLSANLPVLYSSIGALIASAVLGILYFLLKKRTGAWPVKRSFPLYEYIYAVLFGICGAVFFNLLIEFSRLTELFPSIETIEAATADANGVLLGLCTCLLVPLAEELVFRGMGYLHLRKYMGLLPVTLLTAAAFGIFHGNIPQTLYGFCMGLLLAHTAEHYKNLTAVLFFHWSANLISFFFLGDLAQKPLLFSIPVLGLSGTACVWLYYRIKRR